MTKEYDSDRITPENAENNIELFLKDARVGSVELIAFCNALEWRSTYNNLRELRRRVELTDNGEVVPELSRSVYKTRSEVESGLRMAEIRHVLADHEDRKNEGIIPGYTAASVYSHELIHDYEENLVKTSAIEVSDPVLQELRRRDEAFDSINETLREIKMTGQNAGSHWLIGLFKSLK